MGQGGRPTKDKQAARGSRLHVALTASERAELEARAAHAGYATVSDYVRAATLQRKAPAPRPITQGAGVFSPADRRALANIGNNLNQAVRLAHGGKEHAALPQIEQAAAKLDAVLDRYLPQ